jgi:cell wall assembly regulator SMI1
MKDEVMQSMQSTWKRIKTQLRIEADFEKMQAKAALSDFQPGATEEELQAAEATLGIEFPEEVKASYRIHNGRMVIGDPDQNLRRLCTLQEMVDTWEMMKKFANGGKVKMADDWLTWDRQPILVRVETWNVKWIPLLNADGTLVCLDLAPTPHGHMGQIIDSDPENGTYHRWLAPNWQALLSTFADDLEAGEYCYEEGVLTWS